MENNKIVPSTAQGTGGQSLNKQRQQPEDSITITSDQEPDLYTQEEVKAIWRRALCDGIEAYHATISDLLPQTNPAAFVQFVRDHQCPSFLEYAEYPYVSATKIKKALTLKAAFSSMLDQMQ